MNLMARYPDKYFDLAIVDPPYGGLCTYIYIPKRKFPGFTAGANFEIYAIKASASQGVCGADKIRHVNDKSVSKWDRPPPVEYFRELFRVSKHQIVWGGNNFPLPPQRNYIRRQTRVYLMKIWIWERRRNNEKEL